jgi:acetyl-CoA C-acetyltransferase
MSFDLRERSIFRCDEAAQALMSAATPGPPVLVDGARTPIGRLGGALSKIPAVELGARAVRGALDRCPALVPDYIVVGNVLQAGNSQNPGRRAALLGGVAREVPGTTLNDVCLSSMSAVALAASMVREREAECVVVGGFDSMSRAPHALHVRGEGAKIGDAQLIDLMVRDGLWCAISEVGMGELSDRENERLEVSRAAQDAVALRSHQRAAAATESGRLAEEIVAVAVNGAEVVADEGIRADSTLERLAALPPAFGRTGSITAGNASQLSDGASAGLVASRERAREAGMHPLAEIVGRAVVAGPDSTLHLRPAEAAQRLLDRHGLAPVDIDLWEINEAFAGVAVASVDALGIDPERVNVNGGAVALGHPLAASGFRLVLTLAYELRRQGRELGVATMCGGGGQGEALLLRAA